MPLHVFFYSSLSVFASGNCGGYNVQNDVSKFFFSKKLGHRHDILLFQEKFGSFWTVVEANFLNEYQKQRYEVKN
jgi:hypothetical protein